VEEYTMAEVARRPIAVAKPRVEELVDPERPGMWLAAYMLVSALITCAIVLTIVF
jgi:hypothetical protein